MLSVLGEHALTIKLYQSLCDRMEILQSGSKLHAIKVANEKLRKISEN